MVAGAKTEEGQVELWRRVVDPEYARVMAEADDAGMDVVHMAAAQTAALDARQIVLQQAYYLLPHSDQLAPPASGQVRATGIVTATRLDSAAGPRTLKTGVELEGHVVDSMGVDRVNGYWRLSEDVNMAEGDSGPVDLPVEAVVPGFAGNQPAGTITRFRERGTGVVQAVVASITTLEDTIVEGFDVFNVGELNQFVNIAELVGDNYPRRITNVSQGTPNVLTIEPAIDPAFIGMTVTVTVHDFNDLFALEQSAAIEGGRDGTLDEIGRERNLPRSSTESDDAYRERLSRLEDTISPAAIVRTAQRILQPYGIRFAFKEIGAPGLLGFVLDESPLDEGEICASGDPWDGSVLLSENDSARFFVICVSAPDQLFGDPGKPLDSTTDGVNAYDSGGPGDGSPVTYNQVIGLLWRAINHARMAGVNFVIVQDPDL